MEIRPHNGNERPGWLGYIAATAVSALGHAALFALVFFVMPRFLHSDTTPPPSYTVKIVDDIPAGDLGTHLPKLSGHQRPAPKPAQIAKAEPLKPEEPKIEPPKPPPPQEEDKNAVSLQAASPTPTPTPPPQAIPATPEPTPGKAARPRATPAAAAVKPTRKPSHKEPVAVAKAEHAPNVQEQLAKIRQDLLKEQLKRAKRDAAQGEDEANNAANTPPANGESGGGPVVADKKLEGSGYGTGSGTGSAGIQQDLQFLLYYRTVQQKIKDAWIFSGGSNDLTATVDFSIGLDGALTGVKIAQSSNDAAFDDSVVRAIRRAAPFPAPPDKYRSEFANGVEALFKLGDLKS